MNYARVSWSPEEASVLKGLTDMKIKRMLGRLILPICIGAMLFSGTARADEWSFQIEPYIQATSIDGDAGIGRVTGAEVGVDFSDILEVLDIGAMVRFEAHHDSGWGVMLDYGFMDLSDDLSGPRGGLASARLRQGVLEALLVRRVEKGSGELDYMAGIRWWDNDIDVTVDPLVLPGTAVSEVQQDWVDLVVGIRWTNQLGDKWKYHLRGDVGGFGLEADFTASVAGGFHYKMSKSIDLDLLYKAMWVDFEDGTPGQPGYYAYDTVTHGPIVGVIFNF